MQEETTVDSYMADGDVLVPVSSEAIEQFSTEVRDEVGIVVALSNNIMGSLFDVDGNVREGIEIASWTNNSYEAVLETVRQEDGDEEMLEQAEARFKRALTTAAFVTKMEIPSKFVLIDHYSATAIRALLAGQARAKAMVQATKDAHAKAGDEIKQDLDEAQAAAMQTLQ